MDKQISVVVCAKNSESMIAECLESIKLNKPNEIIVVDGNSSDKTVEISRKYADVVISDEGRGLGYARKIGVLKAKNPLVAIVCPDNILPKGCLSKLVKDIELFNFIGVEAQVRVLLDKNSTYWDKCWDINLQMDLKPGEHHVIGNPSLYRREAIIKYQYDDCSSSNDDTDFCLRWRKDGLKVGVGNAIAYEKQRLTFQGFKNRWIWYGDGDARFIWKYRHSVKIWLNHFLHPLRTYILKKSLQAIIIGKIYAVPFFLFCGIFRYIGFIKIFPQLIWKGVFKRSLKK